MSAESHSNRKLYRFGRHFVRALGLYLLVSLVLAYGLAWGDLIANDEVDPTRFASLVAAISESITYTLGLLAYGWWLIFGVASAILALLTAAARLALDARHRRSST